MLLVASCYFENMYFKITQRLIYDKKRDTSLITPCCKKSNKDGKFVNFKGFDHTYGYCHSCGTITNPPQLYKDDKGNEFYWDSNSKKILPLINSSIIKIANNQYSSNYDSCKLNTLKETHKYIDFEVVNKTLRNKLENNLLKYLRSNYDSCKVDVVKNKYFIGTSKELGTVFWLINKQGKAKKAKVSFYDLNGRRTNKFQVPYKNINGFYSCLFGEHLLKNNSKPIILVESEKTAIVASIEFPQYTWLAYGGINGLTDAKIDVLRNEKVLIVPDISKNAVNIMNKKIPIMKALSIDVTIYDMTYGKSEVELKKCNLYNCDIEDILRNSI